jgi:TolA-binding protein
MKKMTILIAALFALAAPTASFAAIAHDDHGSMDVGHGSSHETMDEQCKKECEMLIRNCSQEVDSLQQRIKKLDTILKEKGASSHTRDELKKLEQQLQDAEETLRLLERR